MPEGHPNWRNPREVRRYLHDKDMDEQNRLKLEA